MKKKQTFQKMLIPLFLAFAFCFVLAGCSAEAVRDVGNISQSTEDEASGTEEEEEEEESFTAGDEEPDDLEPEGTLQETLPSDEISGDTEEMEQQDGDVSEDETVGPIHEDHADATEQTTIADQDDATDTGTSIKTASASDIGVSGSSVSEKSNSGSATAASDSKVTTVCSHTYNSGVMTKAATCTSTGTKTYTCAKCGATKTESISATGHSYNSGTVTKAATCTCTGTKTYTCTKCGATKTESIAATGNHSWTAVYTESGEYHLPDGITSFISGGTRLDVRMAPNGILLYGGEDISYLGETGKYYQKVGTVTYAVCRWCSYAVPLNSEGEAWARSLSYDDVVDAFIDEHIYNCGGSWTYLDVPILEEIEMVYKTTQIFDHYECSVCGAVKS